MYEVFRIVHPYTPLVLLLWCLCAALKIVAPTLAADIAAESKLQHRRVKAMDARDEGMGTLVRRIRP